MYRDRRLEGFDAAAVVEVIEHLDPPRLSAFERAIFEFARPGTVVLTTPNREYNVTWENVGAERLRHPDHRFEWTRSEFQDWAEGIAGRYGYSRRFLPVGPNEPEFGPPTQMGGVREALIVSIEDVAWARQTISSSIRERRTFSARGGRMTTSISAGTSPRSSSPILAHRRGEAGRDERRHPLHDGGPHGAPVPGPRDHRAGCTPNTICSSNGRWGSGPILETMLEDRFILFGEWLYARHSVHYRRLPHYFFEFDIYDKREGAFLDLATRLGMLEGTGILTVPVVHRGALRPGSSFASLIGPSQFESVFGDPVTRPAMIR